MMFLVALAAWALGWVLGNLFGYRNGYRSGKFTGASDAYMEMLNRVKR